MEYYNSKDNLPRICGAAAAALYLLALAIAMIFTHFTVDDIPPPDEGITIDFGEGDSGLGDEELPATDVESSVAEQSTTQSDEALLTDDQSDVAIETPQSKPQPEKKPQPPKPEPEAKEVVEEPRTVNKKTLFPGRNDHNDSSTSHGTNSENPTGNMGSQSGSEGDKSVGGGEGLTNIAYDLSGRSPVGDPPKPIDNINEAGKVVIEVIVDERGVVTDARYRSQGSTTNTSGLVEAARKAAMKTRFTPNNRLVQGGTITYTFKLN